MISEALLKRLDQVDLVLSLSFPAVMAVLAILDHSPYSNWLAWGGWLFMILYVLMAIVFRNRSIERNEPVTRRNTSIQLLVRIFLWIFVASEFSLDNLQSYFYASTAGVGLSIVVALFIAFIHKIFDEYEDAKSAGLGLVILVLGLIGLTTFPFVAEIVRHFSGKDLSSVLYLIATFIFEFSSVYLIFARHINSGENAIGPDADNPALFVVIPLGWIFGLGILAAVIAG